MVAGRVEEAAGILDAVLRTSPDDRNVLVLRAVIAERAGNLPAALACVNRASRGLSADGPPPLELHELRTRLQGKLFQPLAEGEAFSAPAWSWPPPSVLSFPKNLPDLRSAAKPAEAGATRAVTTPGAGAATPPVVSPAGTAAATAPKASEASESGQVGPVRKVAAAGGVGVVVPAAELDDQKIRADPAGQWAAEATVGSQYGRSQYSAAKATGAPDVPIAGNSPDAWCPAVRDRGMDWLEVTFGTPVEAVELRVRQNDAPGAVAKVEAFEPDGTAHVWWEGVDPLVVPTVRQILWFAVRVPRTPYRVAHVKLTLNLASGPGYKQVDAVQLVAAGDGK
jgi:hypothetical protein